MNEPLRNLTRNKTKFKWDSKEKKTFEKLKSIITSPETMAYFDPNKQTILRTEASFHAMLFQKGPLGQQLIHFISRRLLDIEKQNKDKIERTINIIEMLMVYRTTPHPAMSIEPYKAMDGREIRKKLDYNKLKRTEIEKKEINKIIESNEEKCKNKFNADKRTKERKFIPGDYILIKQLKRNKWSTQYESTFYIVIETKGSQIRAQQIYDERETLTSSNLQTN